MANKVTLQWSMVTIWPGRDVNELSFLQHMDSVPFAFRYNARFAGMQFNGCVRVGFSGDLEAAGNHVEYLVPVRMDFASVRCIVLDRDNSDGHAIDSGRRTGPLGPGGHREVTVNVEQETRNIDWDNSVFQAILLSGAAHANRGVVKATAAVPPHTTFAAPGKLRTMFSIAAIDHGPCLAIPCDST